MLDSQAVTGFSSQLALKPPNTLMLAAALGRISEPPGREMRRYIYVIRNANSKGQLGKLARRAVHIDGPLHRNLSERLKVQAPNERPPRLAPRDTCM